MASICGRVCGAPCEAACRRGIQCIKGLNAHEPIYVDRLEKVLVRKDMSDPLRGYVSKTKGRFDDDVFIEMDYDEAAEMVADKLAQIIKAKGGNAVGLNGSGQLTMEAQWIENQVMKGVVGSNSIEANARMCMTSAVTGYFHSYGSDAPPTSYEDIEEAYFITFWGIGYNQMLHGQHNTIGLINLHLLTGDVGRPGCGSHSQTGQPLKNTQWRNHIADSWGISQERLKDTSLLKNDGMVVGMMERALKQADDPDRLLAMLWMYTTHIHMPDVNTLVRPALTKMFVVVQDIYRHAPNNLYADVVFPAASKGADCDVSGMLDLERETGLSPYEQLRRLRGVQWPAPNAEIARRGGTPRRYLGQEGWAGKPYGAFRHPDGKARFELCKQDYSRMKEICGKLMQYGHRTKPGAGPFLIDDIEGDFLECTGVCPSGALQPIRNDPDEIREKVSMGTAEIDLDLCYSYQQLDLRGLRLGLSAPRHGP